jgi:hypothetical protein
MIDRQDILKSLGVDTSKAISLGGEVACYCIPGGQPAVDLWRRLRERLGDLQAWPLLCGGKNELDYLQEQFELNDVNSASRLTVPELPAIEALSQMRLQQREAMKQWRQTHPEFPDLPPDDLMDETPKHVPNFAGWPSLPAPEEQHCLTTPFELGSNRAKKAIWLAIVPTTDPVQVPLLMRFGGWNECPLPAIHAAFFRDWRRNFGAEPVAITHDIVEMYVPRPPQTPQEAWDLALAQYAYCNDIVDQGTETVDALARSLWRSPYWYFWWD